MPPANQTGLPVLGTPRTNADRAGSKKYLRQQQRQLKQLKEQQHFKVLLARLEKQWDRFEVPDWHRQLYASRYCMGDYAPEILVKEIKDLTYGTALVQKVMDAIDDREEVLIRLTILRTAYDDSEFQEPAGIARRHLSEQLHTLRRATLAVVESIVEWRRFVAPNPGKRSNDAQMPTVANAVARGALWPFVGPSEDGVFSHIAAADYLLHVARDDSVVKSFKGVLNLSEERDPLLFHASVGGIGPHESGRLCPTPLTAVDLSRLEAARLRLIEDEMALTVYLTDGGLSPEAGGEMSNLLRVLTGPLQLPPLQNELEEEGAEEAEEEEEQETSFSIGDFSRSEDLAQSSEGTLPTLQSSDSQHDHDEVLPPKRRSLFDLEGLDLHVRARSDSIVGPLPVAVAQPKPLESHRMSEKMSTRLSTRMSTKANGLNPKRLSYSKKTSTTFGHRGFMKKLAREDTRQVYPDDGDEDVFLSLAPAPKIDEDQEKIDIEAYVEERETRAQVFAGLGSAFRTAVNTEADLGEDSWHHLDEA